MSDVSFDFAGRSVIVTGAGTDLVDVDYNTGVVLRVGGGLAI
jgi:hypothetical protein